MPKIEMVVHERGLHPIMASRAWDLVRNEGFSLADAAFEVNNLVGETPSVKAVWAAVKRVDLVAGTNQIPRYGYDRCGNTPLYDGFDFRCNSDLLPKRTRIKYAPHPAHPLNFSVGPRLLLKGGQKSSALYVFGEGTRWQKTNTFRGTAKGDRCLCEEI